MENRSKSKQTLLTKSHGTGRIHNRLEDWDDEEDESDFANHLRKQIQQAMQEKA